jgi:hypothetical protein
MVDQLRSDYDTVTAERDRYRAVVEAFTRRVAAIDYTKRHDCWWVNPFDSCEGCDCGWVVFAESLEALAALGTR